MSDFGVGNVTNILREWFGYVDEKRAHRQKQSQVYIRESLIRGGTELEMVRNKIDRFFRGDGRGKPLQRKVIF